jgi:hypothetical protein
MISSMTIVLRSTLTSQTMTSLNTVCCLSKSYAHTNNCKNKITCCEKRKKEKKQKRKTQQHRLGTNVRVRGFKAGLLARSQFASGRSCDRPTRSRFSVVFLGPKANAELEPKFRVTLHASNAALPMVILETRTALTWLRNTGTWPSRLVESQMRQ